MIIFVYGTLMRGDSNNRLLSQSTFLGKATLKDTTLYSTGPFPAMVDGDGITHGELYSISSEVLVQLDRLESNGYMYQRKPVWAIREDGRGVGAEAYFWKFGLQTLELIPGGDWRSYDRF